MIRRAILALALIAGIAPAIAQVPPPVPALPDTERRTTYTISGTTCACAVNFALYGDSTDYQNWVEVFLNGVRVNYNDGISGWTITSPTGPLANIARPVTDAVLTFNSAQTGTIQIVGARRPRRVSQFNENAGVPARNQNQVLTDITATLREMWDKTNDMTGRGVFAPPGETLALLPPLASRQNMGACFDSNGNLNSCVGAPSGSFSAGTGIVFTGTSPTTISVAASAIITASRGIVFTGSNPTAISTTSVIGPGTSTTGNIATYSNTVGNGIQDSGIAASKLNLLPVLLNTLTASGSATLSDITSMTATYSFYEVVVENLIPATNNVDIQLQVHSGGNFQTATYVAKTITPNGTAIVNNNPTTFIPLGDGATDTLNGAPGISGTIRVFSPSTAALHMWIGLVNFLTSGGVAGPAQVTGYYNSAVVVDGFQIKASSGNITSGTVKIYGYP